MAKATYTTPSGVAIPEDEYKSIEKNAQKETIKNVLAVVGVFAVGSFALAWLKSQSDKNENSTD